MLETFFLSPDKGKGRRLITSNLNERKGNLLIYYHNASGLRSRLQQFCKSTNISIYDIVILTETNFHADLIDSEIHLPNYKLFRVDRDLNNSSKLSGGGVLIAVKKELKSRILYTDSRIDEVFVLVNIDAADYILGCVYIPPNSSNDIYVEHCDTVDRLCLEYPKSSFLICGDFNKPAVEWNKSDYGFGAGSNISLQARTLIDCYEIHNLRQINSIPNARGVFLDLFFTHMDNVRVSLAEDCLTNISIHHPAFCLELDISNDNQAPCSSEIIFDFPRGNYNELNKYFNGIDWEVIVSSNSVDSAVQEFYSALYAGMELYIPTKRVETCPSTRPAWFTSRLLKLIMMKKAAHTTYKRTGMAKDYNIFSDIRRSCKDLNDQLHSDYIGNLEDSLVRNPKYFWTFMRNIRNDRGLPCEVSFGDVRLSSVTDIADAFAEHFQSAYVLPIACGVSVASANNVNSAKFREPLSNLDTVISLEEVFAALSGLRDSHSAGPDNLSSSFLKSCIFSLSSPIHKIFNRSLSEGKFPSIWKLSFIQPIHKSGKRDIVENYRGVCLQSVLPKLLDKLVADRLSRICRPLLSDKQHGFCKGRSTLSNLLEYSTFISESLEKGYQVDAVYTDFAKAFDSLPFASNE